MADLVGTLIQLGLLIMFLLVLAFLIGYIYSALTLSATARRLGVGDDWLAWIPVGNLYLLSQMAKMDWWPVLLVIGVPVPFLGEACAVVLLGFTIIWTVKVCEARGKPIWWALLALVPILGQMIWLPYMWGKLAWGE